MKKILIITLALLLITGANFAQGFTQYDLAELLINKAKAEKLIDQKDYSQEEVIALVEQYGLFTMTSSEDEASMDLVRKTLSDYEVKKSNFNKSVEEIAVLEEVYSTEEEFKTLESKERKLSHEFMVRIDEEDLNRNIYINNLDGFGTAYNETFHFNDGIGGGYDVYPLIDKYRYELYRILGWYALEYDLYVEQSPASVALYANKLDYMSQVNPIINVGFLEKPTDDNYDGVAYTVRMKVSSLYYVKYIIGETREEYGNRIDATGYEQAHLVMALKDCSSIFIKDEEGLNAFTRSYADDVLENQDKEYAYGKRRHEMFGNTRYYISKIQGTVFYYIDHDLSKWED